MMENEYLKEKKEREVKYNATTLLSKEGAGKNVMITTILNTHILGKLTMLEQFEIEILTIDNRKIIVFKHAIVSLYFCEPIHTKGVKTLTYDNLYFIKFNDRVFKYFQAYES